MQSRSCLPPSRSLPVIVSEHIDRLVRLVLTDYSGGYCDSIEQTYLLYLKQDLEYVSYGECCERMYYM